ncbi:MAG: tetratricopeptide repeat protein [Rubrivivax sp.]|jgi:putative thioredoxin
MFPSSGTAASSAPPAPDLIYDVSDADFETSVIARSMEVPVLLDCWAPWCSPCRSLTPVLEKVVASLGGAVVLAKLNSDENPQLAAALRLKSIPQVFLIHGGQMVDQFSGALPEGKVREFLAKHVQPQVSPLEQLREEAAALVATDPEGAEALLREGLRYEPGNLPLTLDLTDRVLARGAFDEAQALLDRVPAAQRNDRHAALLKRLALARNRPPGDPAALAARVAADPKDFDARFALAALQVYEGDFRGGFDQLLEVVLRDRGEWREKARKQLVEWFDACPDPAVVSHGRRYLGMYLN